MSNNLALAIRGPIMLMLVGALFALDHFTEYTIGRTWPVVLIAAGVLALWGRFRGAPNPFSGAANPPVLRATPSFTAPPGPNATPENPGSPPASSGGAQ